jgi:mannan endo-1,4-beta-mannosidase
VASLALACAGCAVLRHAAAPQASPVRSATAALQSRASSYLGVYEPDAPRSYQDVAEFGNEVGREPNIALYYSGWNQPFERQYAETAWAHGATVLVQINPFDVSLARLAAGDYDSYLDRFADQVRTFSHPVVIGFAHEMNGRWYPWGRVAPATWIAAWRHLVSTFRQQGADNVTWLWTVNRVAAGIASPGKWWPGSRYVTWIGIDGYYRNAGENFATVFGRTIAVIRSFTSKPILLSEMATYPHADGASQISGLFAGIAQHRLLGFVWFDARAKQDWRLENNPAGLAAVRRNLKRRGWS